VKVQWLPRAVRDLHDQLDWIAVQDPWAAISVGDSIHAAVGRLAGYPTLARAGRVEGTRELVVIGTPDVVVYRIDPAAVVVLRVLHGARRWPAD